MDSKIVVLDDDVIPVKMIEESLDAEVLHYESGELLLKDAHGMRPIAAFIDVYLDSESGLDALPRLRKMWPNTALIVITGDEEDTLVAQALSAGADDFIKKPINPHELTARLRARIAARVTKTGEGQIRFGDLILDEGDHSLTGPLGRRQLSDKNLSMIKVLMVAKGVVISKPELKQLVWGEVEVSDNAIDRKVYELRKLLSHFSERVQLQSSYGQGISLKIQFSSLIKK